MALQSAETLASSRATDSVEPLPAGWVEWKDDNGNTYFHHPESGETQWTRPAPSQSVESETRSYASSDISMGSLVPLGIEVDGHVGGRHAGLRGARCSPPRGIEARTSLLALGGRPCPPVDDTSQHNCTQDSGDDHDRDEGGALQAAAIAVAALERCSRGHYRG